MYTVQKIKLAEAPVLLGLTGVQNWVQLFVLYCYGTVGHSILFLLGYCDLFSNGLCSDACFNVVRLFCLYVTANYFATLYFYMFAMFNFL
jgi:hypothetical protein